MRKVFLLPFLCISLNVFSQSDTSILKFINPSALATPKGYSHAVHLDLGNAKMIIMSGQVALDKQGNVVGKGDLAKQIEQTFLNIKALVEDAGGTMNDVVKISNYLIDLSQIQVFRDIRDKFINVKDPPASTTVQVSRLFREELLVEIEATAIILKRK